MEFAAMPRSRVDLNMRPIVRPRDMQSIPNDSLSNNFVFSNDPSINRGSPLVAPNSGSVMMAGGILPSGSKQGLPVVSPSATNSCSVNPVTDVGMNPMAGNSNGDWAVADGGDGGNDYYGSSYGDGYTDSGNYYGGDYSGMGNDIAGGDYGDYGMGNDIAGGDYGDYGMGNDIAGGDYRNEDEILRTGILPGVIRNPDLNLDLDLNRIRI